jgi:hypothetical protein
MERVCDRRISFNRPKPTTGCSVNGRRRNLTRAEYIELWPKSGSNNFHTAHGAHKKTYQANIRVYISLTRRSIRVSLIFMVPYILVTYMFNLRSN